MAEGIFYNLQQYFNIILNKIQEFVNLHEIDKSTFIIFKVEDKDKEDEVYNIEENLEI